MSRRALRALALLGLAALSAAAVNHCFEPGSVGGSCSGEDEMLCFEADVSTTGAGGKATKGTDPKKVLALMGMVEHLEEVQAKIEALGGTLQGSPSAGRRALKGRPSKGAKALAALNGERKKTEARVAKQLQLLAWNDKGVCKNMDYCKVGTFLPTEQGDAFLNSECTREAPAKPGKDGDQFGCDYGLPPPGEPATLPAIKCKEFFDGDQ
jgi:hypothetical protein